MSDKLFNNLLGIIIGDDNSKFDGHLEIIKKENDDYHHIMAYKKAINQLKMLGYDLSKFLENNNRSEIIDLILAGHILMLNVSQNNKEQGIVYLPNKLTKKQLETFRKQLETFKNKDMMVLTSNEDKKLEFNTFHDENIKKKFK